MNRDVIKAVLNNVQTSIYKQIGFMKAIFRILSCRQCVDRYKTRVMQYMEYKRESLRVHGV